jgi:methyl-accepting chemotaxis protein
MAISNVAKKTKKFRSLAVTLIIAFLILSVVVLLIASILQMYFSFQAQQKIIVNWQQLTAQNAANTVRSFILEKFSILEKAVTLGSLATASPEEKKLTLERLLGKESSFRQLVLLNVQEQELIRVSHLSKLLSEQVMDYNKKELFSKVSQKETYISLVYIDKITSEPMTTIAVPVTDSFGDFKGILMAEVNLKFMWDLVTGIKIGEEGLAYVVDERGNLIAFSDISRVLRGENLTYLKEVNKFVGDEESLEDGQAEISKGIQDAYVLATHVPLGMPAWAVLVELPIREAYQTVIQGIGLSIGTIILGIILATLLGIYLSKRVTKPIEQLTATSQAIAGGNLALRAEVTSRDEVGQLAVAFNEMADHLSAYTTELERKVEERTKELEEAKKVLEVKVEARTKELRELAEKLDEKVKEKTKELRERLEELEKFQKLTVGRELKMIELKKEIQKLKEELENDKEK